MKIAAPSIRLFVLALLVLVLPGRAVAGPRDLLAHASAEAVWIAHYGLSTDPSVPARTLLLCREAGSDTWLRLGDIHARVISIANSGTDLLAVLDTGDWLLMSPGTSRSGQPLEGNARLIAVANDADSLWGIAAPAPVSPATAAATTAPTSLPTTMPATILSPATAPATPLALYRLIDGTWARQADLPKNVSDSSSAVSMVVVNHMPLLAFVDGSMVRVIAYSSEQAWADRGSVKPAVRPHDFSLLSYPDGTPALWTTTGIADSGSIWRFTAGGQWSAPVALKLGGKVSSFDSSTVVVASERLRLILGQGEKLYEQTYDLAGKSVDEKTTTIYAPPQPPNQKVVLFSTVAVALVLSAAMLATARRRAALQEAVQRADGIELAPYGLRLAAGIIDLAPILLTFFVILSEPDLHLANQDPASLQQATQRLETPMLIATAVYIVHTMVGELLVGASVGKLLFGLKVVSLNGQPAKPGQIIVRNLLRIVDTSLLLPLALVLVSPLRQRIADIAAGTLVVPRPESEYEEDEEDDDAEG